MTDAAIAPNAAGIAPRNLRKKAMAGGAACVLFLVGFAAETALGFATGVFIPDRAAEEAMALQRNIDAKADSIQTLSQSIQSKLETMDGGTGIAEETAQLLAAINDLRPDIYAAAEMSGRTVTRLMQAKGSDLSSLGFSAASDFDLRTGQGATVCAQGYTFGVSHSHGDVVIGRLSGEGENQRSSLSPGESVSLTTGDGGLVAVAYRGLSDDQNGIFGFDVTCG